MGLRRNGELYHALHDPSGTSLALADEGGDYVGYVLYDGFGGVLSRTLPFTPTSETGGVANAATGLVHVGGGRWLDPALGRPLQPNPNGGPPTVPQALNRFALTSIGQPGIAEAIDSTYNLTLPALGTGFAKTFAFEAAARSLQGVFGQTIIHASIQSTVNIRSVDIAFQASRTQLSRNRALIEGTGGALLRSSSSNRTGYKYAYETAVYRYTGMSVEEAQGLATGLAGGFPSRNGWNLVTSVDHVALETVEKTIYTSATTPRFSILGNTRVGFVTDAILGAAFQYADDLQNPYFAPSQRLARAGISGGGGALASFGFGVAATYVCGAVPLCLAAGGLVGGTIWAFGGQPFIFEHIPGLQPQRNLAPLND